MDEVTQKALSELLQKVLSGIDTAANFSAEQIPAVIQELLVWNAVSSLLVQLASVVYLVLFCVYIPKLINYGVSYECKTAQEPLVFIAVVIAIVFALTAVPGFFTNFDWIKIWLAPKLYLLDYASSLITSTK